MSITDLHKYSSLLKSELVWLLWLLLFHVEVTFLDDLGTILKHFQRRFQWCLRCGHTLFTARVTQLQVLVYLLLPGARLSYHYLPHT